MAYPRSFLGLLLTGFTMVTLPLVGALAYSAWNTERLARQLAGVEDLALAADYARVHLGFRQIADELLLLPLDEQQLAALKKTVGQEQQLYELLGTQPRRRQDPRRISRIAAELAENAYEVLAISYLVADREVVRLRSNAEAVQRRLILLVIFSPAAALTIALALTRYISRPIAALDASIRQLGGADFSREITVRGPEDLQSLGERLDWLRRRLAELEAEKNRFLRPLSHELKTPLTALREGAELLNDQVAGPLAPPQRQVVSIMRDNSVKLQRLIEDLLDYQRALHAAASLVPRPFQLDALIAEAARGHELAMRAKGQRLVLDLE